ncbi:VPLPA-CTERM sorting domain-containing protein [Pseudotabrizicola formosa]|uniref:VPLPA-CTERM sorting domain-containing protein n=1 Tax=Pseudotabrizicola formosa TaxID=2030009 RepID=UPI000CD2AE9E|nr:VPLPA-CTERM sorting domain-containing protein [Pseudotabrizicola formosa]
MIDTKWVAAAAVTVCMAAGTAQAATYTFDFTDSTSGWQNTLSFASLEDPTVKVTASAGTYSNSNVVTAGDARVRTWAGAGLGVCGDVAGKSNNCKDKDHRIDGNDTNDLAMFVFEKAMQVTSISFSYFDSVFVPAKYKIEKTTCKSVKWGYCTSWNYTYVLETPSETIVDMFDLFLGTEYATTDVVEGRVTFSDLPTVLSFGIGASGKHDAFKITGMTAAHIETPAAVPLPAGGLLLLTAMGGMAALKRRRKAA